MPFWCATGKGNLYGTASGGGLINNNCPYSCGVVFKVDPSGKETVLHAFGGPPDGEDPEAGLTMDEEGNLYGTTVLGGNGGFGTVFKIDRRGEYSVLYSFSGPDGNGPYASLTRDIWGNLYGTTTAGGAFCAAEGGCGVVFKIDRNGKETILHSFAGADGQAPVSNLILDDRGNLYSTTIIGGSSGAGVLFKIDRHGNEEVLHNFTDGADGGTPGDLISDEFGNLYGTTSAGGYFGGNPCPSFGGCGVIYKLDRSGNFSVFHTFQGGDDGSTPYGRLLLRKGHLYGTTLFGGAYYSSGSIFEMDATGKETVLYLFTDGLDGGNPYAGLVADKHGNLYGTTGYGGATGNGVVFELLEGTPDSQSVSSPSSLAPVTRSYPSHQRRLLPGGEKGGPWIAKP